jgi:hypothetical protein
MIAECGEWRVCTPKNLGVLFWSSPATRVHSLHTLHTLHSLQEKKIISSERVDDAEGN